MGSEKVPRSLMIAFHRDAGDAFMTTQSTGLGIGIYSVPEAARLTQIHPNRIRRWMKGYTFRQRDGREGHSGPVWQHDLATMDGTLALSFKDLIEVRFIDAFLQHGVSWKHIREAAEYAAELLEASHPFQTKTFKTDGKKILAELVHESGDTSLLELVEGQYALEDIVGPYLYEGLEFADSEDVDRWYPLADSHRVVIDPELSFGQPVILPEAVPTSVLAQAVETEDSMDRVARWFMVDRAAVEDAVRFEHQLAA